MQLNLTKMVAPFNPVRSKWEFVKAGVIERIFYPTIGNFALLIYLQQMHVLCLNVTAECSVGYISS